MRALSARGENAYARHVRRRRRSRSIRRSSLQTNLFKARKGKAQGTENRRDFADKLCLQMQTKGCAFCRQGLSKNADKFCRRIFSRPFPPKCRQTSSKMQTRALHFRGNCRQIMQTRFAYPESGDVCILVCLQGILGLSTAF